MKLANINRERAEKGEQMGRWPRWEREVGWLATWQDQEVMPRGK